MNDILFFNWANQPWRGKADFAYLGLLGDLADQDIAFGRNEDRAWCR